MLYESGLIGAGNDLAHQHIMWLLGQPTIWLTIVLWGLILIAVVKLVRLLRRTSKPVWMWLVIVISLALLAGYIGLSVSALDIYAKGFVERLGALRIAKRGVVILSILSGIWIVSDWIKHIR